MVGENLKKEEEVVQEAIFILRTTRQKPSKKDLKQNLFKKLQRVKNLEELAKERENQKEDDIF